MYDLKCKIHAAVSYLTEINRTEYAIVKQLVAINNSKGITHEENELTMLSMILRIRERYQSHSRATLLRSEK